MATIEFQFDIDKTREALAYLASKSPAGREKYILCKLLFLADKYHLVRYGRTITGDRYFAMEHGPAPNRTLDLLNLFLDDPESVPAFVPVFKVDRSFRYPRFLATQLPPMWDNLSKSDLEALDETLARHGSKDFPELKALTHEMVAYQNAWGKRKKKAAPMEFEDFFEEDTDAIAGVLEEAIEDSQLRKAFPCRR